MNKTQTRKAEKAIKARVGLGPNDPIGPAEQSILAHRGVAICITKLPPYAVRKQLREQTLKVGR